MARTNRVVIDNGIYHVTSRVTNQEFLLDNPQFKGDIETWIYGIADFSGINVLAWCIMNNHFHLLLHVPQVPKEYWIDGENMPETAGFSMRPAECTAPRWTPEATDKNVQITYSGEIASEDVLKYSIKRCVPVVQMPRPNTGFMLSDKEMIARIRRLEEGHSKYKAAQLENRWAQLRMAGLGDLVDAQKERYCRRMYNISQYMKTLKQRISQIYNSKNQHSGHLWSDRFHSGLVDDDIAAKVAVAAYIDWNAPRAKIVSHAKDWEWCSFGCAMGNGEHSAMARKGYATIFGCEWEEAKKKMLNIFSAKASDESEVVGATSEINEKSKNMEQNRNRSSKSHQGSQLQCRMGVNGSKETAPRMTDLLKKKQYVLNGYFISRDPNFGNRVKAKLPWRFEIGSTLTLKYLAKVNWNVGIC